MELKNLAPLPKRETVAMKELQTSIRGFGIIEMTSVSRYLVQGSMNAE